MRTIERRWTWTGYKEKVLALDPIFYLPLDDLTVTAVDASRHHNNGTHTGVTPNQPGIGDNRLSVYYDGVNDWTECYSAALAALVDLDEISWSLWVKMEGAAWTDGSAHFFAAWFGDPCCNDSFSINKTTTNNQLQWVQRGQGTTKGVTVNGVTTLDWFQVSLTSSISNAAVRAYMNGAQVGVTQVNPLPWTLSLRDHQTSLGAQLGFAPSNPHYGWLAHFAIWDHALTPAQIAQLAVKT